MGSANPAESSSLNPPSPLSDLVLPQGELEALNQKQRGLRYERDRLFAEVDRTRREEDRIRRERQSAEANVKMLNGGPAHELRLVIRRSTP